MERSRRLFDVMHAEDREEAIGLHEAIQAAIQSGDTAADSSLTTASRRLWTSPRAPASVSAVIGCLFLVCSTPCHFDHDPGAVILAC